MKDSVGGGGWRLEVKDTELGGGERLEVKDSIGGGGSGVEVHGRALNKLLAWSSSRSSLCGG